MRKLVFLLAMLAGTGLLIRYRCKKANLPDRGLRSLWLEVDGCLVHARTAIQAGQDKQPVLLLHGLGISSSYFIPLAQSLGPDFTVYAPDLPGHGLSATPVKPLNVEQLAQALIKWMDAAEIKRACLVGQSMGCQVALEAAIAAPERVDRLVLIGPVVDPLAKTVWKQGKRLILASWHERLSLYPWLVRDYLRMGMRIVPELRYMMAYPVVERLSRVSKPVMLVRGEKDPIVPQRWMEEAAYHAGAECTAVIPGWGHAVQHSAPMLLSRAISPFMKMPDGQVQSCKQP